MAFSPQNFVDQKGPAITAEWLNPLDVTVNSVLGGAQTVAQALAALGLTSIATLVPYDDIFVVGNSGVTAGQTVFELTHVPPSLQYLTTTIDGATLIPGIDVTLAGNTVTLAATTNLALGQIVTFHYWA